ncbi:MAG TPA: hypothetical protein PLN86_04485 [Candidatus Hydrogenedentes bacterium]|nr:hypothetical protein [Candidatus Hydrogenedentota bacterium]
MNHDQTSYRYSGWRDPGHFPAVDWHHRFPDPAEEITDQQKKKGFRTEASNLLILLSALPAIDAAQWVMLQGAFSGNS